MNDLEKKEKIREFLEQIKMYDLEEKVRTHEFAEQMYHYGFTDGHTDGYNKGLKDAWEYALKVGMNGCEYYKNKVFPKTTNYDVWDIIRHYSASEAIAKIKEYEKEQMLKVGDVVYLIDPKHLSIVTALLDDGRVVLMSCNGTWWTERASFLHKTGKHYDELSTIIDRLKGNKDE